MATEKIEFPNGEGEKLKARLDLPADQHPRAFALFAHCFTCNKNLTAVRNISRALNRSGIAVFRFDFTGLGESEGDFADTNFQSNVNDLVFAAEYMGKNFQSPSILIGHSLGGAAVIKAAQRITEANAVVTIGAPSDPSHVAHLFGSDEAKIIAEGSAQVSIGGRPFVVKKQFLEEIKSHELDACLKNLNKALLVMHSPQDSTVEIKHAANLYTKAWHPKSFVSLDGADHLLTNSADSRYAGKIIGEWASRYLPAQTKEKLQTAHTAVGRLAAEEKFTTEIKAGKTSLVADEPLEFGGNNFGPSPYELLAASLVACTAMTMKMYALRKEWPVEDITVHVQHEKLSQTDAEGKLVKTDVFNRIIKLEGALSEDQIARILAIANKCPVHKTLEQSSVVHTRLE